MQTRTKALTAKMASGAREPVKIEATAKRGTPRKTRRRFLGARQSPNK
jgi:hypothetical protein